MKNKNNKNNKAGLIIGAIVLLVIIILIFILIKGKSSLPQAEIDIFAKCLTEKGAVMYGAFWCPHCAATKKRFGSSFRYVKYIECDPRGDNEQSELCLSKGIKNYDTWEFADGSRLVGEPSFQSMGEKTGCFVPGRTNG